MKVLILQDYLRGGGTERQSVHLARQLHAAGNGVEVVTFRPGGMLSEELSRSGVLHEALQPLDTGLNFLAPGLSGAIRRAGPDVVLCMGRMANCYAGFIQQRNPDIAVVGTVRTGKPLPALYAWSLRQVCGVLTNTEWWRRELVGMGIEPDRIAVVANGSTRDWSIAERHRVRRRTREALGIDEASVVFLNVAEFRGGKRHGRLIEFFATLAPDWNLRLVLVGDGREWRRCRRLARRLEPRRVHLPGYQADPFAWFCAADVGISASVEDSLPNFLVEAQSLGLPVIATAYQGIGEALRHGETGYLVPPQDLASFGSAVDLLFRDRERRHRMSRNAAAFAAERHCKRHQAGRTVAALRYFHSLRPGREDSHA